MSNEPIKSVSQRLEELMSNPAIQEQLRQVGEQAMRINSVFPSAAEANRSLASMNQRIGIPRHEVPPLERYKVRYRILFEERFERLLCIAQGIAIERPGASKAIIIECFDNLLAAQRHDLINLETATDDEIREAMQRSRVMTLLASIAHRVDTSALRRSVVRRQSMIVESQAPVRFFWFDTASEESYTVEVKPIDDDIPKICIGCRHFHGKTYNGNRLICGMHPYGCDQEVCPDHER